MTVSGPLAHADGGDRVRLCDEPIPGVTGCIDDVVVGVEDAVREPVGADVLPYLLDRVQFRRTGRQEDQRNVLGHAEIAGGVPTGPVEEQHGVASPGDGAGYLLEVKLHGVSVGEGQRQARADAAHRADGAKQIRALVTLIGGLRRPCSAPRPLANAAVLLADARLVLEPDLDGSVADYAAEMRRENAGEVFLKAAMVSPSCFGCLGRPLTCEKPKCFKSLPIVRS